MKNDVEEWREVPGWPKYSVSSHGRVRSLTTGAVMNPRITKDGYASYRLAISGRAAQRNYRELYGHTLVLLAFKGPKPTPRHQCRHHPDPTRTNNHVNNLQWGTPAENIADIPASKRKHRRWVPPPGEAHPNAKLTNAAALDILVSAASARAMAEKYGVSLRTVYSIRKGEAWRGLAERHALAECNGQATRAGEERTDAHA